MANIASRWEFNECRERDIIDYVLSTIQRRIQTAYPWYYTKAKFARLIRCLGAPRVIHQLGKGIGDRFVNNSM